MASVNRPINGLSEEDVRLGKWAWGCEAWAALYIGLSVFQLRKDRREGKLKIPYSRVGRRVVYNRAALDEWLKSRG